MSNKYILDTDGNPIPCDDLIVWGTWMQENSRRVEVTIINSEVKVSTVFLGLDHNFYSPNNPPILFETMVFGGKHDQYQERYETKMAAQIGHSKIVEIVKSSLEVENETQ